MGEQLKTYHGTWSVNANEKISLLLSEQKWRPVEDELRDPERSARAPAVPYSEPSLSRPSQGLIEPNPDMAPLPDNEEPGSDEEMATVGDPVLTPNSAAQTMETAASPSNPPAIGQTSKRKVPAWQSGGERSAPPTKKARQARTCCKCGLETCQGRGGRGVIACTNKCRDCQQVQCRGRNTKKKGDKWTCRNSWDD